MTTRDGIEIAVLLVLLYLSSFFSSAETAFMCVNRLRLRTLSDEGNARAQLALSLLEEQKQKMLTTILIGNNIVNLSASAMTGVMAARLGGSLAVSLATAVLTLIIIVLGEVTPKTAATIRAEQMTLRYVNIIFVLMVVLTPLVNIAEVLARGALFILRINPEFAKTSFRIYAFPLRQIECVHRLTLAEQVHVTITILNIVTIRKFVYLNLLPCQVEVCIPSEILCLDIL